MSKKKNSPTYTKERRERMAKALQLKEQGATFDQIGRTLGISTTRAYNDVQDALKEITREPAEDVLKVELRRIDRLWQVAYQKAMKGDLKSMDRAISLIDRRIKLHGLDVHKNEISMEVLTTIDQAFSLLEDTPIEVLDPEGEFNQ